MADISFALFMFYGPPGDWEGGMEWLRHGLLLAAAGAVHLIVELIFPGARDDASDGIGHGARLTP